MKYLLSRYNGIFPCLIISLLMLPLHLRGEEPLSISGTVSGDNGNAITGAVVSALVNDSTAVDVAITDETGRYVLEHPGDARFLKASKPGFTDVIKERGLTDGGEVNFTLTESPVTLDEFTVTARRATLQSKPGMFVFNPGDIAKHVPNAARVLEYVPLLQTDKNTIQIISKIGNAVIHINGERPMVDQTVILDWLRSMSPEKIKGVEIIMNPGIGYGGSELTTGIVNIILDDDHKGTFGTVDISGGYSNRRLSSVHPRFNIFYQNHSLLVSGYADHYHGDYRDEEYNLLDNTAMGFKRESTQKSQDKRERLQAGICGEYRFNRQSIAATLNYGGDYSKEVSDLWQTETSTDPHSLKEEKSLSDNIDKTPFQSSLQGGIRYIRAFNQTGTSRLTVTLMGTGVPTAKNDRLLRVYNGFDPVPETLKETMDQSYEIKSGSGGFNANFLNQFKDGSILMVYLLGSYSQERERATSPDDYYDFQCNKATGGLSAAYNRQWSRVFGTRIGLQEGFIRRWIYLHGEGEHYNDTFFKFVPNISLSFALGGGLHNINVDWTSSVNDFGSLNPHKQWLSSNTYYMGDPHLGINQSHNFSISYLAINKFFLKVGYSKSEGPGSDYYSYDSEGNTVYRPMNNKRSRILNANFNYNQSFFDYRWTVSASASFRWYNSFTDTQTGAMSAHSVNYWLSVFTGVGILPQYDFSATGNYSFTSETTELTEKISGRHSLNFGLRKGFPFDLDISADISIPLTTVSSTLYSPGLTQIRRTKYAKDVRIGLSVSWSFGKESIERVQPVI